jgi:DNA-binding response OmpR family regulator
MKILIIEDEPELARNIASYLDRQGYLCDIAYNFPEGIDKVYSQEYDCVLLDITLPGGNGIQILKALKQDNKNEGVIIISAKNSLDDKIDGLNAGADDYLPKPFHLSELNARIAAVLRRRQFDGNNEIRINELTIDPSAKTVKVNNTVVDMTRKEFDILLYLVSNKNRVVSRNALAEKISDDGAEVYDNFDFLYAHMKNLKKKLIAAGGEDYIRSVYGMGYKFTV